MPRPGPATSPGFFGSRHRPRGEHRQPDAGMTLVEIVVVFALMMLAIVPIYQFYESSVRNQATLTLTTQLQSEARLTLDRISRELRQTYSGDPAVPAIEAAAPSSIQFLSPDRSQPYRLRRITYRVTGRVLERSVQTSTNAGAPPWTFGPATPFIPTMNRLSATTIFEYLDSQLNPTTIRSQMRTIRVTLTVDANEANRAPAPQSHTATIEIRSFP